MEKTLGHPCKIIESSHEDENNPGEYIDTYTDAYYCGVGKQVVFYDSSPVEYMRAIIAIKETGQMALVPFESIILVGDGFGI
jgi:hypothetical protein